MAARRDRDSRESLLWVNAARQIGPAPAGCHRVDVCDRGADTFEFLEHELRHGRHFVIRSTHSRALEVESERPAASAARPAAILAGVDWAGRSRCRPDEGSARADGAGARAAWAEVALKATHERRGRHGREPLGGLGLRLWEVDAPAG